MDLECFHHLLKHAKVQSCMATIKISVRHLEQRVYCAVTDLPRLARHADLASSSLLSLREITERETARETIDRETERLQEKS